MGLGGLEENGRPSPDAALALGLQKEEELRKEEERKKALDERLRFEQERMEQERQEQEERERRYREREQQIEEHRWVSPHWGPSGHVLYPPTGGMWPLIPGENSRLWKLRRPSSG